MSSPAHLYLDLMKRTLLDTPYIDDPLALYALPRSRAQRSAWKNALLQQVETALKGTNFRVVEKQLIYSPGAGIAEARETGMDWPARAHTMIGLKRLNNLQMCAESVIKDGVPGDFIETGVWRGGACIFMRALLKVYEETARRVWVADSFEGLPPPDEANYAADAGDTHYLAKPFLAVSRADVERNFRAYDLLDDQVRFLEGWFKDTLPTAPIERLAILRLDGDMYESTIQALEALYDKLSPGGFVIVDDFFLKPCAQAVHEFRAARGISDPIMDIDDCGSYWRRS